MVVSIGLVALFAPIIAPHDPVRAAANSFGDPAAFKRPNRAGAHPLRANENNIRDATYNAAFAPERAAVSTTKVIT